jgi:hypothetical protein
MMSCCDRWSAKSSLTAAPPWNKLSLLVTFQWEADLKKLVTATAISFFVLGSSLALAQTAPMLIGKDTSKTGATPPNQGGSAPIAVDPKAKKPTPMAGPDYQHKAGAQPPNAGASAPIASAAPAKKK